MKKKTKKLVLAKETVRSLERAEVRDIAAGAQTEVLTCTTCGRLFCLRQPDEASTATC